MATSQARATWPEMSDRLDRVLHKGPICSGIVSLLLLFRLSSMLTERERSVHSKDIHWFLFSTIEGAETSPGPSSSRRGPAIGPPILILHLVYLRHLVLFPRIRRNYVLVEILSFFVCVCLGHPSKAAIGVDLNDIVQREIRQYLEKVLSCAEAK